MRWPLVVFAPVAALVTACSLLAPVSSLRAGDGGTTGDGGGGTDAGGVDAPTTDGPASDAPMARFCAGSVHTVCDDFDDGGLSPDWAINACNGCAIDVTKTAFTSAPYALATALPRRPANATVPTYATIRRTLVGAWKRTRVEFDFQVASTTWQQDDVNAGLLCVVLGSSTTDAGICVSVGQDYIGISGPGASMSGPGIAWDKWHHFVAVIDPAGSASLTIDGLVPQALTFVPVVSGQNPDTTVEVGIHGYNQPSPDFSVLFDNVTVDLGP